MIDVNPLVSIIIPVYNGADYLESAINSALRQTYKNIEIIVVNDGSNDNGETESIALSFGPSIRYFKKQNGGVSSALNLGLRNMQGDYFSWLSHDDMYEPTKIEKEVHLLQQYGEKVPMLVVGCKTSFVDSEGRRIQKKSWPLNKVKVETLYPPQDALYLVIRHNLSGCSLLIPKKAFEQAGCFDEGLRYSQDFHQWVRIFISGYSYVTSDEALSITRIHPNQLSNTGRLLYEADAEKICYSIKDNLKELSDRHHKIWYWFLIGKARQGLNSIVTPILEEERRSESTSLSTLEILEIKVVLGYGRFVRPYLKRIYGLALKILTR